MFGSPPVTDEIIEVAPLVDAVNMTPAAAIEEYGLMILKVKALYRAVFENKVAKTFLRGAPGLEAWSMLGKAYYHAVGHGPDGDSDYDLVILDAPATGHGLDMLRVPQVIQNIAPPGLLRREAVRALDLFRDPARAGVVIVTLPEDMPTNESIELNEALRDELKMPVAHVVVNRVYPSLFKRPERAALENLPDLEEGSPLATIGLAARARAGRESLQRASISKLSAAIQASRTELPQLFLPELAKENLDSLSRAF